MSDEQTPQEPTEPQEPTAPQAPEAAVEPQANTPEPAPEPASEPESRPAPTQRAEASAGGEPAQRARPAVPGADLEVDIVPEGADPLAAPASARSIFRRRRGCRGPASEEPLDAPVDVRPIEQVAIDLAAGARYRATGKRKTAIARVTLRPGTGSYTINGRSLEAFFPRDTLRRNIRQPLETVGYEERMDVVARMHGGGVSAQAGALRHGISRALLEADPNLRGELKRRGFLTRDARAKERKKAGLKKARKRPQFSKR